jgi:hypothetical protein
MDWCLKEALKESQNKANCIRNTPSRKAVFTRRKAVPEIPKRGQ